MQLKISPHTINMDVNFSFKFGSARVRDGQEQQDVGKRASLKRDRWPPQITIIPAVSTESSNRKRCLQDMT